MSLPVVAIVGRPNVGKSTLFNRLVGKRRATVDDRPGVTRDRLYEETEAGGRRFLLIDTGGIEPNPDTPLQLAMTRQVLVAIDEADLIVFVLDGRAGITTSDQEVADRLRRTDKPVVLAVNKIDGPKQDELEADFWSLGMPELIGISAEHGRGVYDLTEAIAAGLPPDDGEQAAEETDPGDLDEQGPPRPLRIAVIGRPNVGKSTLVNRLIGEDRQVVHDAPGTTMDPIDTALRVGDNEYVLVDTAGVRRRSKIDDQLERYVSLRAIRSIERCHVCLLMIDGTLGPSHQDAALAELVSDRGRGLVFLINKWDKAKGLEEVDARSIEDALARRMTHARWAPHLFVSAKTGKGLHHVLPTVEQVYTEFNKRITTSRLNRFLEQALTGHSPPQKHHHPVRLYYMAQSRIRPPTFVFFSNTPDGIAAPYRRYLSNRLRDRFGFRGTPLRLHFRRRRKLGEPAKDSS